MSHDLDPIANGTQRQGECRQCGFDSDYEICEDCEIQAEARKAPYLDFWAALAVDPELQKSFDTETEAFDSGHSVTVNKGIIYSIQEIEEVCATNGVMGVCVFEGSIDRAIQWCIENREELI